MGLCATKLKGVDTTQVDDKPPFFLLLKEIKFAQYMPAHN